MLWLRLERKKNKDFTIVSNYHLKDGRLSLKAKGLLTVMISLPKDWNFTVKGLAKLSADGEYSVRAAVKELEKYGYLERKERRDKSGRIADTEYTIYEKPVSH